MVLDAHIKIAACDGMRSECDFAGEIPDRGGCNVTITKTPPLTRTFVRSYTPIPSVYYTGGSCVGARARFFSPNETDPTSTDSPHWKEVLRTNFTQVGDACVLEESPTQDGLVAVFEIPEGPAEYEVDNALTFGRRLGVDNATQWFDHVDSRGVWTDEAYAELRMEMDALYKFPGCCDFPTEFNDTAGRLWRQAAYESTCDVVDSAEYVYTGLSPTLVSTHNGTHDRWRFEVVTPGTGFCSPGFLTSVFTVDVYVPLNVEVQDVPRPPYRSLEGVRVEGWMPHLSVTLPVVLITLLVFMTSVGYYKWCGAGQDKQKQKM